MVIDALNLDFKTLNGYIRQGGKNIVVNNCFGQRFIGAGLKGKNITVNGTPGNALGAYLDGAEIIVNGNAQEAVGDTMNCGTIIIHGDTGDGAAYAMRGGEIYIKGNAGYRTGIHMKEYQDKKPVVVVGGRADSFLGEYLAGGIIIVLGLEQSCAIPIHNFTGAGMHGGKIFIRCGTAPKNLPAQISVSEASADDMREADKYIRKFTELFNYSYEQITGSRFYVLKPDTKNPYKKLYVNN